MTIGTIGYEALLYDRDRWHDGTGTVTYSLPSRVPDYYPVADGNHFLDARVNDYAETVPLGADISPSAKQKAWIEYAIRTWNEIANINLVPAEAGETGDITIAGTPFPVREGVAGYVTHFSSGFLEEPIAGDVWLNTDFPEIADPDPGEEGAQTYIHELGHALGLDHPEGSGSNRDYTEQQTGMSYNAPPGSPNDHAITPMVLDIQAVQAFYGANYETRAGDTTYFGPSDNSGFALADGGRMVMTIWDGGGEDTIDASNQSGAVSIDLTPGSFSSIGALPNTIGIATAPPRADGTIPDAHDISDTRHFVENAIGGTGDDTITGNAVANKLDGGAGNDTLSYVQSNAGVIVDLGDGLVERGGDAEGDLTTGFENVTGSDFDDTLRGDDGDNILGGGAGNDRFLASAGTDVLDGGAGHDIVDFSGSDAAIAVDFNGGGLTLIDVEGVRGTRFADSFRGNSADNVFSGGAGADALDGGAGTDTADYSQSGAAVTVDLSDSLAERGSEAEGDALTSIENVIGSAFDDSLKGDGGANVLQGGGGADRLDGGAGIDIASYAQSAAGVIVGLGDGLGEHSGDAEGDIITNIESIIGSSFNDRLRGDDGVNTLHGGAGDDVMDGASGDDVLQGGLGVDLLDGGAGMDLADYRGSLESVTVDLAAGAGRGGEAEGDRLTGIEGLFGSSHADALTGDNAVNTLFGGLGRDILAGGAGSDSLDGGEDIDIVDYGRSAAAVTVDLGEGSVERGGDAEGDQLLNIESVFGSDFDDTLIGDSLDNVLAGGAGADRLDGGDGVDTADYSTSREGIFIDLSTGDFRGDAAGDTFTNIERIAGSRLDDTIIGNDGDNFLLGAAGADSLQGGAGNDTLAGGAGDDTIDGGDGVDTVDYGASTGAIYVNLQDASEVEFGDYEPPAEDGEGGEDILLNVENIIGSAYDDELDGGDGVNGLFGGAGNDRVSGKDGDILDGGAGDDILISRGGQGVRFHGGEGRDDFALFRDQEDISVVIDDFDMEAGERIGVRSEYEASIVDLGEQGSALHLTGEGWSADILGSNDDIQKMIDSDFAWIMKT